MIRMINVKKIVYILIYDHSDQYNNILFVLIYDHSDQYKKIIRINIWSQW